MSEQKPEYITDALEMIGIVEPKQIITEISGWIPVFEVVLHQYKDYMTALVFGRMWQYCGMKDGVCRASLARIGKDIEVAAVTVMRHVEKLVTDGYLIDTTPDRRNAPHEYMDGRKVEMKSSITAGMTFNNSGMTFNNATVIKSALIKQDNTIIKQNDSLQTEKQPQPKPDLVDGYLAMANFPGAKNVARVDAILSYIGGRLQINTETKAWKEFAKKVDNAQRTEGQKIDVFFDWLLAQPKFELSYWPPSKMWEHWPRAFTAPAAPLREEGQSGGYYG